MLLLLYSATGNTRWLPYFHSGVDALAALLLMRLARKVKSRTGEAHARPFAVALVYLFHPFLLLSSRSRTNSNLSHLAVIAALNYAASGHVLPSMLALGTATSLSIYPILLLPPILLLAFQSSHPAERLFSFAAGAIAAFVGYLGLMALAFQSYLGSFSFLKAYWSFIAVSDLTPNAGLSWYFFIEMFDHFRPFFLGVFQLHLLSYVAPLTLKLQKDPLLAVVILLGLSATFGSYPTLANVGFFHTLLLLFPSLVPFMRYPLVSVCVLVYSLALLPAFHYLWLYAGSGNSNFYYASTLVFGLGNGFLVTDLLWAHLKRDFGKQVDISGENVIVIQR